MYTNCDNIIHSPDMCIFEPTEISDYYIQGQKAYLVYPKSRPIVKMGYKDIIIEPCLCDHVKTIQWILGVPETGYFGPITENAVKQFQRKKDLKADGIVGPKTWFALADDLGEDYGPGY